MNVKSILNMWMRRIIFGKKASSKTYINYLKSNGFHIGENVNIYGVNHVQIDDLNPHLLEIGNNVEITWGCTILSHDYSWSVYKAMTGEIVGNMKKTTIGNNVFLGTGSTILGGTNIGDNVIIGAGAVVSGLVEANSVYAGVPARRICSIEEFMSKRKEKQLNEAVEIFVNYYKCFKRVPDESCFHEYFALFTGKKTDIQNLTPVFNRKLSLCMNREKSLEWINHNEAPFDNYDDFVNYCLSSITKNS